jgi:CO/xanthine dehydrogenase FAD-binding subunit
MIGHLRPLVAGFIEPSSLDALTAARAEYGPEAMMLAGGTDLGVQLRRHLRQPRYLISVRRVPDLDVLRLVDGAAVIGARITHRAVEDSPLFAGAFTGLQEACATVGSIQTRNAGTIVGNLCNASPAADTPPVLLTLDAEVQVLGAAGARTLPLADFFQGYRRTALSDDEVVTAVRIPMPAVGTGSAFVKLGRRRAMEISIACVAARITLAVDGTVAEAGVGLGSVAAISTRASAAEDELRGSIPTPDSVRRAARAAAAAASPVDDHRASASYRREMVEVLTERALTRALARATDSGRNAA